MVNIALAGVRSARASSKQGEPSEPWAEEVSHNHVECGICITLSCAGQIFHRISFVATVGKGADTLFTKLCRHAISIGSKYRFSPVS
jgi:hypothetical protein